MSDCEESFQKLTFAMKDRYNHIKSITCKSNTKFYVKSISTILLRLEFVFVKMSALSTQCENCIHDFSITQILREINLTHFEAL